MIVERLNEEERALYEILRRPDWCGEFLELIQNPDDPEPFEFTKYQRVFLLDFSDQISFRAGRAVGKTVSLIYKIIWLVINSFYDEMLFSVPNRAHLDPVFVGLQRKFLSNKFLQYWIGKNSVNSQNFVIKFLNQFILWCRIAGTTGTGVNVVGLHVPHVICDESGYYPWGTWVELQPVINDWQLGHQLVVSGVPDGRREKSVCYACDTDPNFSHHRVSAYENPRFTQDAEEKAIAKFGGKESQEFLRQVLGEHGTPTYAVFDREFMRMEDYNVPAIKIFGVQLKKDSQLLHKAISNAPKPPSFSEHILFGIDLGYTQPTAIIVLYQSNGLWYFLTRFELHQISFNEQEKFIDRLDTKYNPEFLGIDAGSGGQGKAIIDNLINRDEYQDKGFGKRLVPVEFGGTVVIGHDDSGNELKERIKPFSVSKLQQMTNLQQIVFSMRDDDLITELCRVIYTKTSGGNVIYKVSTPGGSDRGDDHNFAALLTFCMVLWSEFDERAIRKEKKVKLFGSRWLR